MQNKLYQTTRFLVLMLLLGLSTSTLAQTPTLVYDINNGFDPSSPNYFTVFNGKLYFAADDGSTGQELWVYDGVNNPSRVADIKSGAGGSDPQGLIVFNNKLYFAADSGTSGKELWVYTGTGSPTMVTGTGNTIQSIEPEFIVYSNALYYSAFASATGKELYKYTGTGSPSLVADIKTGTSGSDPFSFCIYKDSLYFSADGSSAGVQLWRYSGSGNPSLVKQIGTGSFGGAVPTYLTVFNGKLYFSADDGVRGTEVWSWDDTDTAMVGEINVGSGGSLPERFIVYDDTLYFSADDGVKGSELWKYTGTGSPQLVEDIYTGIFNASFPTDFVVYNDTLYFSAGDGTNGIEPRKYGGSGSVILVDDIYTGSFGSFAMGYTQFGSSLYFLADDGIKGGELWKMTATCTPILDTLTVTACDTFVFNGTTYFSSNNTAKDTISGTGCDTIRTLNLTMNYSSFPVDSFITECDSFTLFGVTYTDSTTVDTVFTNSNGCDSLVTFYININKSSSKDSFIYDCNSYTLFGKTYTSSTIVDTVLMNSVGCDSLVRYHISLDHSNHYVYNITACDSYKHGATTYTKSTKIDSLSSNGYCTDTTTFNITIYDSYNRDTFVTVCDSNFTWRGVKYIQSEVDSRNFKTVNGCDSIITLHLTVAPPTYSYHNVATCYRYAWRGNYYENSGTYYDTIANSNGCDSILVLDLTINGTTYADTFVTACVNYEWRGVLFTESTNNAFDTMVNANGCDSVVRLNLTINKPTFGEITVIGCDSITVNDSVYKETGNYEQLLQSVTGCDSTLTVHFVIQPDVDTASISKCGRYVFQGVTYTQSGFYRVEVPGCDTVVLDLTINTPDTTYIKDTGCGNYIYEYFQDHGGIAAYYREIYDESGIYYVNIKRGTRQCDSVIKLDLLIYPSESGYRSVIACDSFTWRDSTYYETGLSAIYSYVDGNGCDADSGLAITINKSVVENKNYMNCFPIKVEGHTLDSTGSYVINAETEDGCNRQINVNFFFFEGDTTWTIDTCDSYELNGIRYTQSGIYKQAYAACPHDTITINLTIRKSTYTYDTITSCYSYTWEDSTYTESTTDIKVFQNSIGCDSIRTLYLTIDNGSRDTVTAAACISYNWRGEVYSASGFYTDTLLNKNGCDSITVLDLEIFDINKFAPTLTTKQDTTKFKFVTAISGDGNTLAVAYYDQKFKWPKDTAKTFVIKMDVYGWDGSTWQPKGNNPIEWNVKAGIWKLSLDLDADGDVLAMGIIPRYERYYNITFSSIITFAYNGSKWNPNGQLIGNRDKGYGYDVSLSADGQTLASGYPYDKTNSSSEKEKWSHAAVFRYSGGTWIQMGPNMRADGTDEGRGTSVSLSADGRRIIVGGEAGYEEDDNLFFSSSKNYNGGGVVYYWDANSATWLIFGQRLILPAYGESSYPYTVGMSGDGNTVIVHLNNYSSNGARVYQWNSDSSRWDEKLKIQKESIPYNKNLKLGYYGRLDKVFINNDGSRLGVSYGNSYHYTRNDGTTTGSNFSYMQLYEKDTNGNYQRIHSKYFGKDNLDGLHKSYDMASDTGRIVYVGSWFNNQYIITYDFCVDIIESVEPIYSSTSGNVNFTVYPNPTSGIFTLKVDVPASLQNEPMHYEVLNMQGMTVLRGTTNGAEGRLTIGGQPAGVYFVKFQIGNVTGTAKIVLQE